MPRLLIEQTSGAPRAFELKPGITTVGRSPENQCPVDDASVSPFHCEFHVRGEQVFVKDLGSARGTFVEGKRVTEWRLKPGQKLRLGSVELQLEGESKPEETATAARPAAPAAPAAGPRAVSAYKSLGALLAEQAPVSGGRVRSCPHHPGVPLTLVCQKCLSKACTSCVKETPAGVRSYYACPVCGGICVPLSQTGETEILENLSPLALVGRALSYPLQKGGLLLLLAGVLFFSLLDWANAALGTVYLTPPLRIGTLVMLLIPSLGYYFSYLSNIAVSTAQGSHTNPGWPDFMRVGDDIGIPFLQCFSLFVIYLAPGLTVATWVHLPAGMVLLGLGLLCVPMALLTVSLTDRVQGLRIALVCSAVRKVPRAYLVAVAVFLVVLVLAGGVQLARGWIKIPLAPELVFYFILLYGLALLMRFMGLFYRKYRSTLSGAR